MTRFILQKIAIVLSVSAAIVVATGLFSTGGRTYAGFMAALLGAVYLLNAWVKYMKSRGRMSLPRFKFKSPPVAPFFHRNDSDKIERPAFRFAGRHFNDSLEEEMEDAMNESLSEPLRLKAEAAAYTVCGLFMLIGSLFIS